MKNYEINEDTLVIMPDRDNYGQTRIIETDEEYIVSKSGYEVMDESCQYYGSTYKGRIKAAQKILDCSYKIPIIVEESSNLIFFPTKSSLLEDCIWLNMNSIKNYKKEGNKTRIIFNNNKEIVIDISRLSLQNQIYRSIKLESIIRKRIENLNQK